MTTTVPKHLFLAAALALPLAAQGTPFAQVVPDSAAASEGANATALPFGSTLARRVQYAYDGSAVGYRQPVRIAAIELRCDGGTAGTSAAGSYNFSLTASTCARALGALSTTFLANQGPDHLLVHSGVLAVPAPPVGSTPNAFALRIPCSTPFEWDPRLGPLLLDFQYFASTPAFAAWDAVDTAVGGVAALGSSSTTASSVLTTAPVLRLDLAGQVAPIANATADGASGTAFPWGLLPGSGTRVQCLYGAAATGLTGRQRLTSLAWRTDNGGAYPGASYTCRITLSTSSATETTLGTTFANNTGPDATVVFDGTLVADPSPASSDLTQFDLHCDLQRTFEYDPARGALLVDIQTFATVGTGLPSFDCSNNLGNGVARVLHSANPNATTTAGSTQSSPQRGVALTMAVRTLPVPTVPAALANAVNANLNTTSFPFGNSSCRSLQIVSAAEAGLAAPTFVRGLRFRPSTSAATYGPTTITCTIDLSTGGTTPATVVPGYDGNHGSNRLRVFSGRFSVPFGAAPSAADPSFPLEIRFQQPFLWQAGNAPYLCIDVTTTAIAGPNLGLETTSGLAIDDARVFGANLASGTTQTLAATVQLATDAIDGLAVNYGAGCSGTNGIPFTTTVGLPQLPNPDFALRLRNALGNTPAFLLLGFAQTASPLAGAPGCTIWNGLELGTYGFALTDPVGDGRLGLPLGNDPAFEGFTFLAQWVILDAGANALGLTTTDGQRLTMKFF